MSTMYFKTLLGKSTLSAIIAAVLLAVGLPQPVKAGNWRVAPIKINFDARTRSEVITITNEGNQALSIEISAMQWLQNDNGQDDYRPAPDLIFFPKQLVIAPHSERVVRTGIKVPALNREKTYRLFIKEVPDRSQTGAATVAIAVQFGVPVFVRPEEIKIAGAINEIDIVNGTVSVQIENQGNSHFRVQNIIFTGLSPVGEQQFTKELKGWYLLNNRSHTIELPLPKEICRQIETLDIQVKADQIELNERINVDPTMCTAP